MTVGARRRASERRRHRALPQALACDLHSFARTHPTTTHNQPRAHVCGPSPRGHSVGSPVRAPRRSPALMWRARTDAVGVGLGPVRPAARCAAQCASSPAAAGNRAAPPCRLYTMNARGTGRGPPSSAASSIVVASEGVCAVWRVARARACRHPLPPPSPRPGAAAPARCVAYTAGALRVRAVDRGAVPHGGSELRACARARALRGECV